MLAASALRRVGELRWNRGGRRAEGSTAGGLRGGIIGVGRRGCRMGDPPGIARLTEPWHPGEREGAGLTSAGSVPEPRRLIGCPASLFLVVLQFVPHGRFAHQHPDRQRFSRLSSRRDDGPRSADGDGPPRLSQLRLQPDRHAGPRVRRDPARQGGRRVGQAAVPVHDRGTATSRCGST